MADPVNVLVLIHGITPERDPAPAEQYQPMIAGLRERGVRMAPIAVEWGITDADGGVRRPDQRLSRAERHIAQRVRSGAVHADGSPQSDVMMTKLDRVVEHFGIPVLRQALIGLREEFVQFGLADAVYYASAEGEHDVRHAVYGRVLGALEEYRDADDVRLHIVAHSLGVTIAHDFLYGLFAPEHAPDFARDGLDPDEAAHHAHARQQYLHWRGRARAGALRLGTFVSMASQLPLTLLRRRTLVRKFFEQELLDPAVIGITPDDRNDRWAIFYDVDDALGFATRRLYRAHPAIRDIQVQTGLEPVSAHLGYWSDARVLDETARMLRDNAR